MTKSFQERRPLWCNPLAGTRSMKIETDFTIHIRWQNTCIWTIAGYITGKTRHRGIASAPDAFQLLCRQYNARQLIFFQHNNARFFRLREGFDGEFQKPVKTLMVLKSATNPAAGGGAQAFPAQLSRRGHFTVVGTGRRFVTIRCEGGAAIHSAFNGLQLFCREQGGRQLIFFQHNVDRFYGSKAGKNFYGD